MNSRAVRATPAWGTITLLAVMLTVTYADLSRFLNPVGEKFVPNLPPGQVDFSYAYLGARALAAGVNPYLNDRPEFTHPVFGVISIEGQPYKQLYPIGQLTTFVPLVHVYGADWQGAGRAWFQMLFASIVGLGWIATWLSARLATLRGKTLAWLVMSACFLFDPGVGLGLERGQSDAFSALLCWGAVALLVRGRLIAAMFLLTWGTTMKGYPLLLAVGVLGALPIRPLLRACIGGAIAVAVLVLPAWRFVSYGLKGMTHRAGMFWPYWYNHAFRNVARSLSPHASVLGERILPLFALAVAGLCWAQTWRAMRDRTGAPRELWLVAFATSALAAVVGYSQLSISYNLVLVLPGALILAVGQRKIAEAIHLSWVGTQLLGLGLLTSSVLLFQHRIGGGTNVSEGGEPPASGFGLVLLVLILGVIATLGLLRDRTQEGVIQLRNG